MSGPDHQRHVRVSPLAVVAGIAGTLAFHSGLAALLLFVSLASPGEGQSDDPKKTRTTVAFVDAKLVRLGREFSPREMPNKLRATRSTGPAARAETPSTQQRRAPRQDEPPPPPDSVDDLLTRLGQSAAEQARIAEESEREGHTGGIEEGTETDGNDRALYQSQLYRFFRRGFQMPASVPDSARQGLAAAVRVYCTAAGVVERFDIASSGNPEFDQAVRLRMGQAVGATLPPPPSDAIRNEFFGSSFQVRFTPPR